MTVADNENTTRSATGWLRAHPALGEFGIVGCCLLIYFLIRGNVVDEPRVAFRHAVDVVDLEKRLGFFWEPAWQQAIRASAWQTRLWNYVYFWLHAPVIAALAIWLYRRHHTTYVLIRNAFLVSALFGLLVYAVYPVAPPRLMTASGYREYGIPAAGMPVYGFEDTMKDYSNVSYQAESLKPFVNPFAAVPSLHFGWAFLIGLAVALAVRNRFGIAVAVILPVLMFFGVVLTANHFIFDAIAGLVVCCFGLVAAIIFARVWPRIRIRGQHPAADARPDHAGVDRSRQPLHERVRVTEDDLPA